MVNQANNLQAAGAMIQAGTSLVDSFLNLGRLLSNAAQALYLLKNAGSEMDTMVPKLKEILSSAHEIFNIYWSPKKRFEEWINMVTDTCMSAAEKLSTGFKEVNGFKMFYAPAVITITGEIQRICVKIDKCVKEGKALEDALVRRAIKRVVEFRDLINITNVDTLNKTLKQILVKLESERSVLINLYGEFGTGKRVILEHLNNDQMIVRNKYNIVIWASASYIENPDQNSNIVAGIQRIIADRLGIDIQGNNNVNTVAEKIDVELKALKFLDYDHKVEVPSPSGYRILESLIRKSLLIKDSNKQYVIMSKLLRGVAVHYLEQDRQLIKGYVAIEKPEEQKLDGFTTIQWLSFANCNIKVENIPTNKRFGKVTALFLQKNSELEDIPTEFIDHMNELQVLDLHKIGIKSIIPVRNLRSLKVLYVNSCNLLQSFSMDKEGLDELEVLDIRGIVITQIPDDIKKLKKLRRLMISISRGCNLDLLYISGILQLKELIVDVKSDNSSKEKDYDHNRVVTHIIESIHNLDELCTLQFHFQHVVVPVIKVLDTFSKISVPNLESLVHLLEGKAFLEHEDLEVHIGLEPNVEISTHIHVNNSFIRPSDKNGKKYEPGTIYSNVQTLIMIKNDEICNICTSTGNMNDIHSCLVYECNKVETFMKTVGFSSLKILILSKCSALKVLFSNNTLREMGIEHLEIRDCPAIEDIDIVGDGGGGVVLPSLMTLALYNLPELKLEKSLMSWPLLKTLRMHRCGNMTKLPFKVDGPTKLCMIEVEKTWWDKKLRLSDSIKMRFVDYCKFR